MRVGLVLPTFHADAARVTRLATEAEEAGIDGVFLFDHLWHLGKRGRPALHGPTLISALGVATSRITVGSLVARVGIQPNPVLARMMGTAQRMSGGRTVAGLGIGDGLSREENEAYGIEFAPRPARIAELVECCRAIREESVPVWIGGATDAMWSTAAGEADAVNVWDVGPEVVARAAQVAQPAEVTWAGLVRMREGSEAISARMKAVAEAGATWAIGAIVGMDDGDVFRFADIAASTLR
ncbi:MAG: LLM class flavin-dependent oxidoreductase [Actinobacteria bacterium]|nr:LLM class flavin-dependent oxidoreductase [Actinomycetota bacterium]